VGAQVRGFDLSENVTDDQVFNGMDPFVHPAGSNALRGGCQGGEASPLSSG
jgi:hypothetical protein